MDNININSIANSTYLADISMEYLDRLVEEALFPEMEEIEEATEETTEISASSETTEVEEIPEDAEIIPNLVENLQVADNTSRFQGAMWFHKIKNTDITIAGLGGIGSWTALLLSRLQAPIILIDPDTVEFINLAGQFYSKDCVEQQKCHAIRNIVRDFSDNWRIYSRYSKIEDTRLDSKILICGFDNMEARKNAFSIWEMMVFNLSEEARAEALFIDGRLDAEDFQIFCITGDDAYHIDIYKKEYLYQDAEVDDAPCSFKQTSYLAAMIGSFITNLVVNFVSNTIVEYSKSLPFKTAFNTSIMNLQLSD